MENTYEPKPLEFLMGDTKFRIQDERAEKIQRAWKNYNKKCKSVNSLLEILPEITTLCDLQRCPEINYNFSYLQDTLQKQEVLASANGVLSKIPKQTHINKKPRSCRSSRALLSSFFFKYCPSFVFGEDSLVRNEQHIFEINCLKNASSMLLSSLLLLEKTAKEATENKKGAYSRLSYFFNYTWFSYNYFTHAFSKWKAADQQEVCSSLLESYATIRAALSACAPEYRQDLLNQLVDFKESLSKLLQPEELKEKLDAIEAFVDSQFRSAGVPHPSNKQSEKGVPHNSVASESSSNEGTDSNSTDEFLLKSQHASEVKHIPSRVKHLLSNEKLAHELIFDGQSFINQMEMKQQNPNLETAEEELEKRIHTAMHKAFWDQVITSIEPQLQASVGDFKATDQVMCKYDDQSGYYPAEVLHQHSDGNYQIKFLTDDVPIAFANEPLTVPLRMLKRKLPPSNFTPLLNVLEELREKLVELTPNRADIVAGLREKMDTNLMAQMLQNNAFDVVSIDNLLSFVSNHVLELQAPAREEPTRLWLSSFRQKMESENEEGFLKLLPEIMEFFFEKIREIKQDIAIHHAKLALPYFQRNGIEYEQAKLNEALKAQTLVLNKTEVWLQQATQDWLQRQSDKEMPEHLKSVLLAWAPHTAKAFLAVAFTNILQSNVRLDSQDPSNPLPETLRFDGRRLSLYRDAWDRLSLVATMSTVLQQALAQMNLNPLIENIQCFQGTLNTLLQQDGVHLPQLVEMAVQFTKDAAVRKPEWNGTLPFEEETRLRNLMTNCVRSEDPVFMLFFSRIGKLFVARLTGQANLRSMIERLGLNFLFQDISQATSSLERLFRHHCSVHSTLYRQMLLQIVKHV